MGGRAERPIVAAVAVVALGAAALGGPSRAEAAASARLVKRFHAAIADAAVYRHADLRRLRPLRFAHHSATVATLTGTGYPLGRRRLAADVWVSGVPEVQRLCRRAARHLRGRRLKLYLRELLGLHPTSPAHRFVTFRVRRADVFRPAVDPDPTTHCPCAHPRSRTCGLVFPRGVSSEHVAWMARQMLSAWVVASPARLDGYPWTRLGYTYDWRPGAGRYGASEYVVGAGSIVDVTAVTSFRAYCR